MKKRIKRKRKKGGAKTPPFQVKCPRCGHVEALGAYAVAQLSMRHTLRGKCQGQCGAVHIVSGDAEKPVVELEGAGK